MITFLRIWAKSRPIVNSTGTGNSAIIGDGGYIVEYSKDNGWPEEMDVTEEMGQLILSAQRAARNELRRRFTHAIEIERER